MTFDVTAQLSDVKIMPRNEIEEIIQNVQMIIATNKFTVPMDRGFGVDSRLIDLPIGAARAKWSAEIAMAIREQEPRARVQKVNYSGDATEGQLTATVTIEIVEKNLRGGLT